MAKNTNKKEPCTVTPVSEETLKEIKDLVLSICKPMFLKYGKPYDYEHLKELKADTHDDDFTVDIMILTDQGCCKDYLRYPVREEQVIEKQKILEVPLYLSSSWWETWKKLQNAIFGYLLGKDDYIITKSFQRWLNNPAKDCIIAL